MSEFSLEMATGSSKQTGQAVVFDPNGVITNQGIDRSRQSVSQLRHSLSPGKTPAKIVGNFVVRVKTSLPCQFHTRKLITPDPDTAR